MQHLPKLVRDRLSKAQPASHPDPDQLAAFAEHSLAGHERSQLLDHLAACADCREVLALAQPLVQELPAAAPAHKRFSWLRGPMLRWGTAAALVVIVGAAVILPKQRKMATPVPPAKVEVSPRFSAQADKLELSVTAPKDELDKMAQPQSETVTLSNSSQRPKQVVNDKKIYALKAEPSVVINGPRREVESNSSRGQTLPSVANLAPAPPPAPQGNDKENASRAAEAVESRSGTVEVTAPVPAVIARETAEVSKAKDSSSKTNAAKGSAMSGAMGALNDIEGSQRMPASRAFYRLTSPLPRWTISADGALQRSLDSGKTWEKVAVGSNAIFRAVSAVGPDVWVGGSAGLLYHSPDAGQHWILIHPTSAGATLKADIRTVEFTDAQHGKLTTAEHEIWKTSDAGQSWQVPTR